MIKITSTVNKEIVKASSLKEKKFREEYGLYLIEGARACSDSLSAGADITDIYALESVYGRLSAQLSGFKGNLFIVSQACINKICGTVQPQGIAAAVRIKDIPIRKPQGDCLVLDGVSDPGNLGAIIRTAAAAGISEIYLADCADVYNLKCVRSAMGGLNFTLPMKGSKEEILKLIKDGTEIIVADMGGENAFEIKYGKGKQYALVIGGEAEGVSALFKKAGKTVSIPMKNIESLNAAVAASILIYSIKQNRGV